MRAYFAYDEGGIEELGEATREQVPLLIKQAEASLSGGKQFGVGFYLAERFGRISFRPTAIVASLRGCSKERRTSIKSSQDAIWPLQLPASTLIVRVTSLNASTDNLRWIEHAAS
jgi:hypothetical protein